VLLFLIIVPLAVAAATSVLLARREAHASAGAVAKHPPRAAGFGPGGQPIGIETNAEPGLRTLLDPDYHEAWWRRALRLLVLAVLLTAAAAVVAAGIYFLGKWAGEALKSFVTSG
jgi:hypothetical protein